MFLFTSLSWLSLPSTILLVSVMFLTALIIFKRSRSSLNLPPGPPPLPIIGNMHQLGVLSYNSLSSLSKTYGPLMHLRLGSVPTLIISSAELAREVMKYQDLNFCSRPPFLPQKWLSYNFLDIAFSPYGEYWREMRKVCMVERFNQKRIQSFGFIREEEVARMVASISEYCSSSKAINLSDLLVTLTSNIICRAAFGKSYIGGAEKSDFHKVFEETEAVLVAFFFSDFIPQLGWIDKLTGLKARLEKNFFDLDAFHERVIDEHLDPKRPRLEHQDFVDVLIQVQEDHNLTRDHIKGVLTNILLAGTSTGSATVVWSMSELIRNPRVTKIAQDEVRRVIGSKNKVEESDLAQLQYLNLVLKETLRLHSPSPLLIPRETIRHCMINGYDILPKTLVFVNTRAIGRDPECWRNPDEFIPERFANSEVHYKGNHFELIPFGAGRRICPGMSFGMITVELTLANLLYYFNWEFPSGVNKQNMDMSEAPGITVNKKSDLLLVATKF
ncbi:hypothetical protein MRB53_028555 [Persea americana]|uniref:Uncharacterized protein n=1 Tax=Persea americana TaxID=3435 RepID=A0ACC2KG13_PERAE|nr:hypothetical protein MRB53_028555 [Persea americana]